MKLRTLLSTGVAACSLVGGTAAEAGGYYISVFGGYSSPDSDLAVGPFSYTATKSITYQTTEHHYGIGKGAYHFFGTPTFTGSFTVAGSQSHTIDYYTRRSLSIVNTAARFGDEADDGFVVGGAIGMDFDDGLRFELESAYRSFDLGDRHALAGGQTYNRRSYVRLTIVGFVTYPTGSSTFTSGSPYVVTGSLYASPISTLVTSTAQSDGDLTSFSLMANVWYDFDLGPDNPLVPFIGAGLGMAKLDLDYRAGATFPSSTGPSYTFSAVTVTTRASGDDWVFAWQAGAGIGYEFAGGMMLSAQYRYFATGDADIGGGQDIGVSAHEGLIGLSIPLGN